MDSKVERKILEKTVRTAHTDGLIKFIADQIPDAIFDKGSVSDFLNRAYKLEMRGNVLVYLRSPKTQT